jgi:hypothetical protein
MRGVAATRPEPWWRSALLCDCCGSRRVVGHLDGSVWVVWAAVVEVFFVPGERKLGLHLFPKLILVVELPNTNNWTS